MLLDGELGKQQHIPYNICIDQCHVEIDDTVQCSPEWGEELGDTLNMDTTLTQTKQQFLQQQHTCTHMHHNIRCRLTELDYVQKHGYEIKGITSSLS